MNKTAIIIGSVALLAVGAYLYFKGKAKPNEETMETDTTGTGTIGTDTTGTGTTIVNPLTGMVTKCMDKGKSPFLQDWDVNCYLT
jgi:hypothetical protein